MASEQRRSGASSGWSRCFSASCGCSLAMVSSVVVATRWNCRAATLSWMCSKSRICKEKETRISTPSQGASQQPMSLPCAALLGAGMTLHVWRSQRPSHSHRTPFWAQTGSLHHSQSQRLEARATHRALCSTVPSVIRQHHPAFQ